MTRSWLMDVLLLSECDVLVGQVSLYPSVNGWGSKSIGGAHDQIDRTHGEGSCIAREGGVRTDGEGRRGGGGTRAS